MCHKSDVTNQQQLQNGYELWCARPLTQALSDCLLVEIGNETTRHSTLRPDGFLLQVSLCRECSGSSNNGIQRSSHHLNEFLSVRLSLEDRQAVVMRTQSADPFVAEECIAIQKEVLTNSATASGLSSL